MRLVALCLVGLAACGGKAIVVEGDGGAATGPSPGGSSSSAPPTGPDPSSSPFDMCGKMSATCGASSMAQCAQEKQCFDNMLRAGVALPLEECLASACGGKAMETCLAQAAEPYATDKTFLAYNGACQNAARRCGSAVGDTYCDPTIAMVRESILAQVQACFTQPCQQIDNCAAGVLAQQGCNTH
jgi:hypothetical protein